MYKLLGCLLICIFPLLTNSQTLTEGKLKRLKKKVEKKLDFVYIPSGILRVGDYPEQDVPFLHSRGRDSIYLKIDSFFISKYELTNGEYLDFLKDLKKTDTSQYKMALPDTLAWRSPLAFNDPYVEYYLRHPVYFDHPVVNITYDNTIDYCEWITEKVNSDPDRIFEKVRFRLPKEREWRHAAEGGREMMSSPLISNGDFRTEDGKPAANIVFIGQLHYVGYRDSIYVVDKRSNDTVKYSEFMIYNVPGPFYDMSNEPIKAVGSYEPQGYGTYNMAGNVEEMVLEEGWSKGGSWRDGGAKTLLNVFEKYDPEYSSPERGVRLVMEVIEY